MPLQGRCGTVGGYRYSSNSSMTAALEGGEWSAARPGRTLPPGKSRYPLYRRLGGPQGRCGQAENLVPTGIPSPDRPDRSQSLYRLSYPAHKRKQEGHLKNIQLNTVRIISCMGMKDCEGGLSHTQGSLTFT